MRKDATLSPCGKYRYELLREWDSSLPWCVFIMLNPSTADAEEDDPTIRRCVAFAKSWGLGRLLVVNLFALRSTDPENLLKAEDPVGPYNETFVRRAAEISVWDGDAKLICAWGTKGGYLGQDKIVRDWLDLELCAPMVLRLTKEGHPAHPLYLPKTLNPVHWKE